MSAARGVVVAVVIGVALGVAWPAAAAQPAGTAADKDTRQTVVEMLDRMPLLFVPEQVSPDGGTGFAVRGREASVWLSDTGLAYRLHGTGDSESKATAQSWVVALELVGATPRQPVGEDPLPSKVSYFKGPREQWRTGLPSYGSVRYQEPWPGVDLVVSGTAGELESTFVVRPGADPGLIRLAYRGAEVVRLEADGSLVVDTPVGEIREEAPFAYQEIAGRRVEVAAAFEFEPGAEPGRQAYRFRLGDYDPGRELVVDPVTLVYCGYIGGADGDFQGGISVDDEGRVYVTGHTYSTASTFPVTVGPDLTYNGDTDAFVARINATGTALDYCGYIGGSEPDWGEEVAVDGSGDAYVTGSTWSTEATFPATVGPDLTHNGDIDAFVAKVNAPGTGLDYCGYIGGSGVDHSDGVAVDAAGNAYIAGDVWWDDGGFPVSVGPDLTFNGGDSDAFVAKVRADGSGLDYCGYIGGADSEWNNGIAVDAAGNAYVAGYTGSTQATFPVTVGPDLTYNGGAYDGYVARVNAAGTALDYCGYVGGSGDEWGFVVRATSVAVDADGRAFLTGSTDSTEGSFPVTMGPDLTYNGGAFDGYVARVNAAGTALDYCGYIGGSGDEWGMDIAVDAAGNAYVIGETNSTETSFPVTVGPDLSYNGGPNDVFVARVNAVGTALDYCGYIGGSGEDWRGAIAVDAAGNAYVTGSTTSTQASFPVVIGPDLTHNGDFDVFVAKVSAFNLFTDGFESGDTSAWSATVP